MRITNVSHAEVIRTMEGNLLIRYTVNGQTLSMSLEGTMDVLYSDLRPWVGDKRKLERVK